MATNALVEAESRERPRVAALAGVGGILILLSPFIPQIAISGSSPDNLLGSALLQSEHKTAILISTIGSALGLLAFVLVLDFLLRATRARMSELPPFLRPLLLLGGIAIAVANAVLQIVTMMRLDDVVTNGTLTWEEVQGIREVGPLTFVVIAGQIAFVVAYVMVVLNAQRVGLLTRFMGILGAIGAVLFILPLLPVPIVQAIWLLNLAWLLFSVGGAREPPAWTTGEAVAWPSQAEVREQRVRAAEARRAGGRGEPATVESVEDVADEDVPAVEGLPGPARKRKKRR